MDPLLSQLTALQTEIKTSFSGSASKMKALQDQVDAIDIKLAGRIGEGNPTGSSFEKELKENEDVQRLLRDQTGVAVINFAGKSARELFERKTTIATGAGVTTSATGVLTIDRIAGITEEARQVLRVRDVLTARPTTMQVVDFVKVLSPLAIASPVPEASLKPENALTFLSASERVKTIATWIPATKQMNFDRPAIQ